MLWLERPPYLRWSAAALLIVAAAWVELKPKELVRHPYLAEAVAAGGELTEEMLEWREIPPDLLPRVEPGGRASHALRAGEPLLPSSVAVTPAVPTGWWALSVPLPAAARLGAAIQLVVVPSDPATPVMAIPGLVLALPGPSEILSAEPVGTVAVPPEQAATAAAASSEGRLVVLVEP